MFLYRLMVPAPAGAWAKNEVVSSYLSEEQISREVRRSLNEMSQNLIYNLGIFGQAEFRFDRSEIESHSHNSSVRDSHRTIWTSAQRPSLVLEQMEISRTAAALFVRGEVSKEVVDALLQICVQYSVFLGASLPDIRAATFRAKRDLGLAISLKRQS